MRALLLLLGLTASTLLDIVRAEADAAVHFAYAAFTARGTVPATSTPPATKPTAATMQQLDRIKALAKSTEWPADYAKSYLESIHSGPKKTFGDMSSPEADALIKALEKYQAAREAAKPAAQPATGGCANGSCGVPVRRWGLFR